MTESSIRSLKSKRQGRQRNADVPWIEHKQNDDVAFYQVPQWGIQHHLDEVSKGREACGWTLGHSSMAQVKWAGWSGRLRGAFALCLPQTLRDLWENVGAGKCSMQPILQISRQIPRAVSYQSKVNQLRNQSGLLATQFLPFLWPCRWLVRITSPDWFGRTNRIRTWRKLKHGKFNLGIRKLEMGKEWGIRHPMGRNQVRWMTKKKR